MSNSLDGDGNLASRKHVEMGEVDSGKSQLRTAEGHIGNIDRNLDNIKDHLISDLLAGYAKNVIHNLQKQLTEFTEAYKQTDGAMAPFLSAQSTVYELMQLQAEVNITNDGFTRGTCQQRNAFFSYGCFSFCLS